MSKCHLEKRGFSATRTGVRKFHVECTQCQAVVINNIAVHEHGCPNARKAARIEQELEYQEEDAESQSNNLTED